MTPGVNITVAIGLLAAIGDISRFASPGKLVSYFGLNPRVRQSGLQPAQHGRISKIGRSHARDARRSGLGGRQSAGPVALVLPAHPCPSRATGCGRRDRSQARDDRLDVLTDQEDTLQLQAGLPAKRGQKGIAAAYSVKALRDRERAVVENAERAYTRFVGRWKQNGPRKSSTAPS